MSPLPADYLERVYAGVLGKLIGVYVGRPFEGWTHQRIMKELGPIHHYVHEKLDSPLVVTDDDVSGTFAFVRALEEHGVSADLTSEAIGKTWINNVIEKRSVFWWGGKGISTEHTAFLNLKHGIKAPLSGAIETNGKTVAEQIGAQIFIDGWAMVAPGNPALAAKLAGAAGSVSHDGESVYAAKLWAAMEAEAFVSKDVNHLLDVGLKFIPENSKIARLVREIRAWVKEDGDWTKTRQRIENDHGYDKFCGVCHVIPNHGIMIMALLYAGHDFHQAMHIINTCGWDTDCNSGNVGCLVAIINGLSTFDGGPDWRGPLADRALISSADGGYSINDAARIALDIANVGRQFVGEGHERPPKEGAQYHFTLPGSVQGFQARLLSSGGGSFKVEQDFDGKWGPGLAIRLSSLSMSSEPLEVLTPTFTPKEVLKMREIYELMASPLVYPGQRIIASLRSDANLTSAVLVRLRLKFYTVNDGLINVDSPAITLEPGKSQKLEWIIPHMDSQPIQQAGIAISLTDDKPLTGTVWLDNLRWDGTPHMTLRRPHDQPCDFWHRAWVNGVSIFHRRMPSSFTTAQDKGEGVIIHGTREWTDYRVVAQQFNVKIGGPCGVAIRVRGLNRYYALMLCTGGRISLVKALDDDRIELASATFDWQLDVNYNVIVEVQGDNIRGWVGHTRLDALDSQYRGGSMGLVVTDGSLTVDSIQVGPLYQCQLDG